MDDELRRSRRRQAGLADEIGGRPDPGRGTPTLLGTVQAGGPTTLPGVFAVTPASAGGTEAAGGAATVSPIGGTAYFTVVGTKAPVAGETLVGHLIDSRWVAERWAGATDFLTGKCGCSIPAAITFLGFNAGSGNSGFPNFRGFGYSLPVVLTYQSRPSALGATLPVHNINGSISSLAMPAHSWFSSQFTATGDTPFQCFLWLRVGNCALSLRIITFDNIYGHSAFNEWGVDGTGSVSALLKTSTGGSVTGNTCSPFALNNISVQSFSQVTPSSASPGPAFSGTHGSDDVPTDAGGNAGIT